MQKFKKILWTGLAVFMLSNLCLATACAGTSEASGSQSSASTSAEEHLCPTCGKCAKEGCEEEAHAEKCEGHTVFCSLDWWIDNAEVKMANGDSLPDRAEMDSIVAFEVTPKEGYTNLTVRVNGQTLTAVNGVYEFVMKSAAIVLIETEKCEEPKTYQLTDATLELKEDKVYYVLKGTYTGYTDYELRNFYFDFQNYKEYNSAYGWNTERVSYVAETAENAFAFYVDLSQFPIDTCQIPHFNGKNSEGDVKLWESNGKSIVLGDTVYTIDLSATPYGVSSVLIFNKKDGVSAPSDTTPPAFASVQNYQYYQTTELPRIDINTENGLAIDDESLVAGWKVENAVHEYDYVKANISVSNCEGYELEKTGKVKVRGNYSSTYPKRPIRIKFDKKQMMCGLNGDEKFKDWVLLADYKDSSMLRNSVAFYLGNSILGSDGYYCSDFRYVEVYLNGVYNGLYLLVEQQQSKEGTGRIGLPEAIDPEDDPTNPNLKNTKIGYLVEYDGYYYTEKAEETFEIEYNRLRFENGSYLSPSQKGFTIKSDVYYVEQRDFIQKCVQNIWDIIYDATQKAHTDLLKQPYYTLNEEGEKVADPTIQTPREAVEKVVDVKSLVDTFILNEICEDADLGWSSFYMSLDMSETGNRKLVFEAPWDFDSTLGSSVADTTKFCSLNRVYRDNGSSVTPNPWLMVLGREAWFWTHVQAKWTALENAGTFTGLLGMIDYYATNYVDIYAKNFTKWPQCIGQKIEGQQIDLIATFKTQKDAAEYLKTWVAERIENLDKLIDEKVEQYT